MKFDLERSVIKSLLLHGSVASCEWRVSFWGPAKRGSFKRDKTHRARRVRGCGSLSRPSHRLGARSPGVSKTPPAIVSVSVASMQPAVQVLLEATAVARDVEATG